MLSSIGVKNFGCFDEYQYNIKFNKMNVIVGPNNSGKSMILKALNMIRDYSYTSPQLNWNNDYCALQNNLEAVFGHDTKRVIELTVQYKNGTDVYDARMFIQNDKAIRDEFLKNSRAAGPLASEQHKNLASQIWYFHPLRRQIPYRSEIGSVFSSIQPIDPSGYNVVQFLLERFNDRDTRFDEAQNWLIEIDKDIDLMKTPIIAKNTFMVTKMKNEKVPSEINLNLQGTGINNAVTIIAAIIFSPPNSTIIIEEPENFLHRKSVEKLVDLFNYAVVNLSKQIIITTHSWNIIGAYTQDVAKDAPPRGGVHVKINSTDFSLLEFSKKLGKEKIQEYPLKDTKYEDVVDHFLPIT